MFKELGGTFAKSLTACGRIMQLLRLQARVLGVECPIGALTVTMFRSKGTEKPKLKLKAAETRYLIPILREVLLNCFFVGYRVSEGTATMFGNHLYSLS